MPHSHPIVLMFGVFTVDYITTRVRNEVPFLIDFIGMTSINRYIDKKLSKKSSC